MVVGARSKGSKLRLHRNVANLVYNFLASYVTQFPVKDLTSGISRARTARRVAFHRFAAQHVFLSDDADAGFFAVRFDG